MVGWVDGGAPCPARKRPRRKWTVSLVQKGPTGRAVAPKLVSVPKEQKSVPSGSRALTVHRGVPGPTCTWPPRGVDRAPPLPQCKRAPWGAHLFLTRCPKRQEGLPLWGSCIRTAPDKAPRWCANSPLKYPANSPLKYPFNQYTYNPWR